MMMLAAAWFRPWHANTAGPAERNKACPTAGCRLYEPSGLLAPTLWHCTSSFQAIPRGRCRILDWRPHCGRQSKVLLVGGDGGARAWIFRKAAGRWAPTALFAEAKRVVAANWAPTLSRPVELVAIATETSVRIWSLAGRLHTPQVSFDSCQVCLCDMAWVKQQASLPGHADAGGACG